MSTSARVLLVSKLQRGRSAFSCSRTTPLLAFHRHQQSKKNALLLRPWAGQSCCSFSTDESPQQPDKQAASSSSAVAIKAYLDLSKARLSALVVATTAAGFLSAGTGPLTTMTCACVGTALCSSSAAALNQIFEIDRDAQMKRTQQRPLVTKVLSVERATAAAAVWGVTGTSLLAVGTDPTTTALGVGTLVLYSGIYTYMKPRTIYNTWVGAIVGAIPPMMGWSAATGGNVLDIECLLLGGTLYLWQMPHFFALSYMHRVDYARGGFQMVPVLEEDGERTANLITRYAWYLSTIPIISTVTGVTSIMFGLEGIVLNAYALYVAHDFSRDRTNAKARKVFLTSLWYLPCLLTLFILHSKTWDTEKKVDDNVIRKVIDDYIHMIRNKGRELCVHEAVMIKDDNKNSPAAACPVIVGKQSKEKVQDVATTAMSTEATASSVAP